MPTIRSLSHIYALFAISAVACAAGLSCVSRFNQMGVSVISEKDRLRAYEEIGRSVLQITSTAYYENYYYAPPQTFSAALRQETLLKNKDYSTSSVAGTGLIIYKNPSKILLLTCHHIVEFVDTLKTYYLDTDKKPTRFLESLSIQYDQNVFVTHMSGTRSVGKIIVTDRQNDIALIESVPAENQMAEMQFQGRFDTDKSIRLGKEVYLLGFPKGNFMITSGLASPTSSRKKFVIDTPFNQGFSGGVVVAFSEDYSSYTYLGMANSSAYSSDFILAPPNEPAVIEKYQNVPYEGEAYLKELNFINYGISFAIKSNVILEFLESNADVLERLGYRMSHMFKA